MNGRGFFCTTSQPIKELLTAGSQRMMKKEYTKNIAAQGGNITMITLEEPDTAKYCRKPDTCIIPLRLGDV